MKHILHFWIFLFSATLVAQQIPKVTVKDAADLKLTDLAVEVKIIGNVAVTTYDMKFYNGLDRTLEGELVFPLGEGQIVSGFSMDVNGAMREAVIVEKELGRVAYENTMRQVIDPGLLEKTEGNNYRTRVYPILAKRHKHIVITFEQELHTLDGMQVYELPLGFTEKLSNFSATINVYTEQTPLVGKSNYKDFYFQKQQHAFVATVSKTNHAPTEAIVVRIQNSIKQENLNTYNGYFYYTKVFKPTSRLKKKPKKITLLWDASYSMQFRDVTKELQVLESYLKYVQNVHVDLITFNNQIKRQDQISIQNGDTSALISSIKNTVYDGGTSMGIFNNKRFHTDEILLFSDGLLNLGTLTTQQHIPVYTINSLGASNHEYLQQLATATGGNYLNLVRASVPKAVQTLKRETFQFLGIEKNNKVFEVYPKTQVNVWENFSISGQFAEATQVTLLFGYGGKVTEKVLLDINVSEGTQEVKRLWAKKKLTYLNQDKEANKEKIITLSKQFRILTDYTSMIVLDRLEDYVRYKIEPPAELMENYKELLAEEAEEARERNKRIELNKEEIEEDYQDIIDWYFGKKKVVKPQKENTANTTRTAQATTTTTENTANKTSTTTIASNTMQQATNTTRPNTITGIVLDDEGEPLPGANVYIIEENRGTTTDFDGKFTLQGAEGMMLRIAYVGFEAVDVPASATEMRIQLKGNAVLDEVVVVAYGSVRERKAVASAIATVESESIDRVLQGSAAGVQISTGSGQPGQNSSIIIRGRSSFISNGDPLFVIDGVPSTKNVPPDDIQSITVLKQPAATALYGIRGRNGVMIITTKKGASTYTKEIDSLNKKIEGKIQLKSWNADMPYIKLLEKEKSVAAAYQKYIQIRSEYTNMPTFYIDVADFFYVRNAKELAVTIITNLVEIELANYELLKAAAYKLEYFEQMETAVKLYEKVLELRPEEPQSYRDLALAYEQVGKIKESYDLLYKIYDGQLLEKDEQENYLGMEAIAFTELARLTQQHSQTLKINKETLKKLPNMPVDVRVVIDWNHVDTDIDLWVVDPNGEKAFYKNPATQIGGRMSNDLTEGYGPEDFMLKDAIEGMYTVYVNHYSDDMQKVSGPTILKVTLYTNYGKKNQTKKTTVVRLEKKKGELEVGNLFFSKK
ncbi:VIT domain-containing protein [Kordia zhangzhouensis]|uniref:VIT domain-containing protein n=1 Tax=Kordia zhangzhouensis TaxID=1620405 RepID=UPI00069C5D93|nr:VIT domain-containing protein [Kordia zhangzhouensis]